MKGHRLFPLVLTVAAWHASAASNGSVHVTGNLLTSSCSVTSGTNLTYDLSTAMTDDLPAVDSTTGRQEQNIVLSCDTGVVVYMTINGDHSTNDNTILNNTGTAQGVGIQLLNVNDNYTPIAMGNRWVVINSTAATNTVSIAAQYIRTGTLATGTVESSATYTLDYE
ncbi:fimbrial protein [Enterobacter wuhouensis]|uniref:fimbrial protein n=1 Tax=Enterobacter wuhouensis TaxID=2529381 RepID=UPI002FD70E40